MKIRFSIPTDRPDKSEFFFHYAQAFKVFKGMSTFFKPLSVSLVTVGLIISLGLIQFSEAGIFTPLPYWLVALITIAFAYAIEKVIGFSEGLINSSIRYLFLWFSKEETKKGATPRNWKTVPDIILHVFELLIAGAITYGCFFLAHNSGVAISEGLNKNKGSEMLVVNELENKDSLYNAKKDAIFAKYDTLITKRQKDVVEQIAAATVTLGTLRKRSERKQQTRVLEGLQAEKTAIAKEFEAAKNKDLAELSSRYEAARNGTEKVLQKTASVQSTISSNASSVIIGFLGFDAIMIAFAAAGKETIRQKNGIQPTFEVEHGDFDESELFEVLKKPFQIAKVRMVNWSRNLKFPDQIAPTEAGAHFNRNNIKQIDTTPKKQSSIAAARKVFSPHP